MDPRTNIHKHTWKNPMGFSPSEIIYIYGGFSTSIFQRLQEARNVNVSITHIELV